MTYLLLSVGYFLNSTKCCLLHNEGLDIMYDTSKENMVL